MLDRVARHILRPILSVTGTWRAVRRTVAAVPDVVEAILVLPHLSEQLDVIGFQTATLNDMYAEIERVRADTSALPPMGGTLERMATLLDRVEANTAAVEQLAQIVLPLEGAALRVGRMADRWPARRRLSGPAATGPRSPS